MPHQSRHLKMIIEQMQKCNSQKLHINHCLKNTWNISGNGMIEVLYCSHFDVMRIYLYLHCSGQLFCVQHHAILWTCIPLCYCCFEPWLYDHQYFASILHVTFRADQFPHVFFTSFFLYLWIVFPLPTMLPLYYHFTLFSMRLYPFPSSIPYTIHSELIIFHVTHWKFDLYNVHAFEELSIYSIADIVALKCVQILWLTMFPQLCIYTSFPIGYSHFIGRHYNVAIMMVAHGFRASPHHTSPINSTTILQTNA